MSVLVTHPGLSVASQATTLPLDAKAKMAMQADRIETLRRGSYRYETTTETAGLLVQVLLKMVPETETTKVGAHHGRGHG